MKKNKCVLLTGASRGIGLAILNKLKQENYTIVSPSRRELNLQDKRSLNRYLKKHKNLKIDILINNAASANVSQWIYELEDNNLEESITVNLLSPIKLIRAFVRHMMNQKWGRIINISSIFGIIARGKHTPFVSTKHGLNGMTKALALELAPYNILVNSVCPGFTKTDSLMKANSSEKIAALEKDIPLGRLANPEEIANLVAFLISNKNTYITGANIIIDGGFTCK